MAKSNIQYRNRAKQDDGGRSVSHRQSDWTGEHCRYSRKRHISGDCQKHKHNAQRDKPCPPVDEPNDRHIDEETLAPLKFIPNRIGVAEQCKEAGIRGAELIAVQIQPKQPGENSRDNGRFR